MKILYLNNIYEDFLIIEDMLSRIQHFECEISFTENVEHALDSYLHHDFDLYLMDYSTNPERATEFLKRIQTLAVNESLSLSPVIVIYHKNKPEIKHQALKLGAQVVIEKYDLNALSLVKAISQVVSMHSHNLPHYSKQPETLFMKPYLH